MKRLLGAVGILALAATMPQALAQDTPKVEQPAQPAAVQPLELPPRAKAILEDKRPLSEMNDKELAMREQAGAKFAAMEQLPAEIRAKFTEISAGAKAELAARQQQKAEAPPKAVAEPAPAVQAEAPVVAEPPKVEKKPKLQAQVETPQVEPPKAETPVVEPPKAEPVKPMAAAPAAAPIPDEVNALLADNRPLDTMSVEELKSRFKVAVRFSRDPALPPDVRQKLKEIAQASRQAAMQAEAKPQVVPQPKSATAPVVVEPPAKVEATPVAPATPPVKAAEATPVAPPAAGAPPV